MFIILSSILYILGCIIIFKEIKDYVIRNIAAMKNIKLILKGMLLWVTAFTVLFFISGIDGLMGNGYFIQSLVTIVIMVYTCYKLISEKELKKITMYKWANKLMEEQAIRYAKTKQ